MPRFEPLLTIETSKGPISVSRREDAHDHFFLEGVPTRFANADESLRVFRMGPFPSIEAALHLLASDGAWAVKTPTAVHAEVRAEVWALAQANGESRDEWASVEPRWRELCGVGEG